MKTSLGSLSIFLFFTTTTYTHSLLYSAEAVPVLDADGDELQVGSAYKIVPALGNAGGGLRMASTGFGVCPQAVIHDPDDWSFGSPVTFNPAEPEETVVKESTDLNIKFHAFTFCFLSTTVWNLRFDEAAGEEFVMTGGIEGNPGNETLENWFRIQKYGNDPGFYKIFFCPSVCKCSIVCGDISVFVDDQGRRRLALIDDDDNPFVVTFKKASFF